MIEPAAGLGVNCRRCDQPATIKGRNEALCESCFVSYIESKVVKRLEKFRVKYASPDCPHSLLFLLSPGIAATVLLHVLDTYLGRQRKRTGRTGFKLQVVHVCRPDENAAQTSDRIQAVKEAYPGYESASIPLFEEVPSAHDGASVPSDDKVPWQSRLLASIPTITSRLDVLQILTVKRTVDYALDHSITGVVFGASTTQLAERILAETAKGRGFSLPWQISDGPSPWGLPFYYPVGDLLEKELATYAELKGLHILLPKDASSDQKMPAASKDGSIDVLMKAYFESAEQQYPSIVANVVRTVGKLEAREMPGSVPCRLCAMPTVLEDEALDSGLCYGCARAVPQSSLKHLPPR